MACLGLGATHLGIFPARATIWGVLHQVILLGKYGIWGGIHGGKPRRARTTSNKHLASLPPGVARDLPVQEGRRPGRGLPIQMSRRLGGQGAWHDQGAWHIGSIRHGGLAPRCPAICPYKRAGSGPGFADTNGSAIGRAGSLAYPGPSGLAVWLQGALGFAYTIGPAPGPGLACRNVSAFGRSGSLAYPGRCRRGTWPQGAMESACTLAPTATGSICSKGMQQR